jgi:Methyltransferase domain
MTKMRDVSTLLPFAGGSPGPGYPLPLEGTRTFYVSLPEVRKSLRLRYGAVTSENGTPGDGSAGRGTGPAPGRAAKRQPAGTPSQTRAAGRPRAAEEAASADRDQGSALATESQGQPAVADRTGTAATAAVLPAAGTRPTEFRPGAPPKTTAPTSRSAAAASTRSGTTASARPKATPARPGSKAASTRAKTPPSGAPAKTEAGADASAAAPGAAPDTEAASAVPPATAAVTETGTASTAGAGQQASPPVPPPAARSASSGVTTAGTAASPASSGPAGSRAGQPAGASPASTPPESPRAPAPAAAADPTPADDAAEGFWLLAPAAAGRREARPVTDRPVTPAASTPAEPPAAEPPAAEPAEATDWYKPTVASTMPYEFPSTGSVRLIPPTGRGTGNRPAPRPSATTAPGRAAVSPTPPGPVRPPAGRAAAAAEVTAERAAPRYVIPGPPGPGPTAATDRATTAPAPGGRAAAAPATAASTATGQTASAGATGRAGTAPAVVPRLAGEGLFARHTRSYAAENSGQQITILQAGCTTAEDLGADPLRAAGARLSVSMIDEDNEVTRAAVAHHQSMSGAVLGDLRTVLLPPRTYDIVQCSALLGRIEHAELVLDRLSAAVKPGGLLLLRIRDRDSAGGFLDRVLPGPFRRAIWRNRQPGEPGPHVAVYERLSSGRGVQAYVLMHGLVIAERGALGGLTGGLPGGPHGYRTAQQLVAWLSRGRLTPAHEDLLYVIRKPEDRFARII